MTTFRDGAKASQFTEGQIDQGLETGGVELAEMEWAELKIFVHEKDG